MIIKQAQTKNPHLAAREKAKYMKYTKLVLGKRTPALLMEGDAGVRGLFFPADDDRTCKYTELLTKCNNICKTIIGWMEGKSDGLR